MGADYLPVTTLPHYESKKTTQSSSFSCCGFIFQFLINSTIGVLLSIGIIFLFGFSGPWLWHLGLFCGFFLVNMLTGKWSNCSTSIILILFVLVGEVVVLAVTPCNSLIPRDVIFSLGIARDPFTGPCAEKFTSRYEAAQEFFGDAVDFSRVSILNGGAPRNFGNAGGMGIDTCVYFDDFSSYSEKCTDIPGIVHELTHIWQFQTGWWWGIAGPWRLIKWAWMQSTCGYECLYEYGCGKGLHEARVEGKTLQEFGPEQMAMINENYYSYLQDRSHDDSGCPYDAQYGSDLAYYSYQCTGIDQPSEQMDDGY